MAIFLTRTMRPVHQVLFSPNLINPINFPPLVSVLEISGGITR
jgi:hypothetical protein